MKKFLLSAILLFFTLISANVFAQQSSKDNSTTNNTRLEFSEYKILEKENKIVVYFDIAGIKDQDHKNEILSSLKDMPYVTFVRIYKSNRGTDHCQLISTNTNLIPEEIQNILKENNADFNYTSVHILKNN